MARYQEMLTEDQSWLHELAKGEMHPEADRLLNLGKSFDPQQMIEESTIDFLEELREQFTLFSKTFNSHSENGTRYQEIKIYSVAQTPADFMLYRNQIKLVVSNTANGVIKLSFAQHQRGASIDGQKADAGATKSSEIAAQMGPFRDIFWAFDQHKVTPQQVARFYFSEFVKATRDVRSTRAGNQMLLEQIKTLLQEKGFDL